MSLNYIITARKATGTMPENIAALESLASFEMTRVIAEENGVYMAEISLTISNIDNIL